MPTTNGPAPLTGDPKARYGADGFLTLRRIFMEEEIAEVRAEAERLLARTDLLDQSNVRCRWQNHVETGECRFDCFDPVIDLGPAYARVARDRRILDAVSALYREPGCLFKDKLIFKRPGALGYGLHQDYISWPTFPTSFVTVIVALDSSSAEYGKVNTFFR